MHKQNLHWLWLTFIVIIIDQTTKNLAIHYLSQGPMVVTPFFNLILTHNLGSAFNFLSQAGGWQRWFLSAVSITLSVIIFIWLLRLPVKSYWMAAALSLILGGAIGNLLDRIQYGYVIDFIQIHYQQYAWPVFNMADSAITVGAVMLVIAIFKKSY